MSAPIPPWSLVMEAVDAGLKKPAMLAFVRARYKGPPSDGALNDFASYYRTAIRPMLRGEPCDGSQKSLAARMLYAGATLEEVHEATRRARVDLSKLRTYTGHATGKGFKSKRAERLAESPWPSATPGINRHPHAPLRSRVTISEAIMLALSDGHYALADVAADVERRLKRPVRRATIASLYSELRMAKLALDGHRENTLWSRIATELLDEERQKGNDEVARELGTSIKMVATVRTRIRAVQADRLSVDPTFHYQPSQHRPSQSLPR